MEQCNPSDSLLRIIETELEDIKASKPRWVSKAQHKGQLYFISDGEYVKIGRVEGKESYKVANRLASLQTANARKLNILHVVIDDNYAVVELEMALHQVFSQYRMQGEWFDIIALFTNTPHNQEKQSKQSPLLFQGCDIQKAIAILEQQKTKGV